MRSRNVGRRTAKACLFDRVEKKKAAERDDRDPAANNFTKRGDEKRPSPVFARVVGEIVGTGTGIDGRGSISALLGIISLVEEMGNKKKHNNRHVYIHIT